MSDRAKDPEGRFTVRVPAGWQAAPDDDGDGLEVWREEGVGTLHLISFAADDPDDFPDPAEELYAFLEQRGVELEEDEVEDVALAGDAEMALCEFLAEDEDEEDPDAGALFWCVAVAAAPGMLVFATYFCRAGEEEGERELVRQALASVELGGTEPA